MRGDNGARHPAAHGFPQGLNVTPFPGGSTCLGLGEECLHLLCGAVYLWPLIYGHVCLFPSGLVRAVDVSRRLFFVHTPVAPALLPQVTVLARGPLALPAQLAMAAGPAARCPYLSFDFSAASVAGTNQRKARVGLGRKRLAAATPA